MINTYDQGDLIRLDMTVTVDGTPTDPATVVCKVKAPDGTVVTKTLGTDNDLVQDSAGVYHLDVNATAHGRWHYRWEGTGAAQGAEEGRFDVRRSVFV